MPSAHELPISRMLDFVAQMLRLAHDLHRSC
jgi:hypothetical protein